MGLFLARAYENTLYDAGTDEEDKHYVRVVPARKTIRDWSVADTEVHEHIVIEGGLSYEDEDNDPTTLETPAVSASLPLAFRYRATTN